MSGAAGIELEPERRLRPLGVGEILDTSIKLYAGNARTLLTITAAVVVPLAILQELIVAGALPSGAFVRGGILYTATGSAATTSGFVARVVLGLIGQLIVNGALALCAVDVYIGRPLSAADSLRTAAGRLAGLLWLAIAFGIVVSIAFVLILLPGIWLSVMWSIAVPALMFERLGGVRALRRSFSLVRHRWWATFAELLVGFIMLAIALFVVGLILGAVQSALGVDSVGLWLVFAALTTIVSNLIAYPFIGTLVAVIYIDQRVRKEALDLELMAGSLRGSPDGTAGPATGL